MANRPVFIIEDDIDIRESLKEVLEMEGFEVRSAVNGRDGLDQLQTGELPALVLLDVTMPVMDGWQFLEERKKFPRLLTVPVMILTAANERRPVPSDAAGILKKPVDLDQLLAVVRQHCVV